MRPGRLRATLLACAVLAPALPAGTALADAGDLDPAFGEGGRQVLAEDGHPEATLVQPDGRIVIASGYPATDFVVRRLLADGSPDRSFDGDGTAIADLGALEEVYGAALHPDGSIIVVGRSAAGIDAHGAMARFTSSGRLDPAFSPGGTQGDGRALLASMTDARAVPQHDRGAHRRRAAARRPAAGRWRR